MSTREIDIADVEHLGAIVAGGLLVAAGCRQGGTLGKLFKAGGWALVMRGQHGYGRLYNLLGIPLSIIPTKVSKHSTLVRTQIVIRRSQSDLYRIWRNFENLPVFMDHILSVRELDDRRSHWVAKAPVGMVVKWDSEIIRDVENKLIAWRSMEGSGIDSAGSVRFEPLGPNMTLMKVRMRYDPPASRVGAAIAQFFKVDPERSIEHDLKRFKGMMELEDRLPESVGCR